VSDAVKHLFSIFSNPVSRPAVPATRSEFNGVRPKSQGFSFAFLQTKTSAHKHLILQEYFSSETTLTSWQNEIS
jgi:hypothetical protein